MSNTYQLRYSVYLEQLQRDTFKGMLAEIADKLEFISSVPSVFIFDKTLNPSTTSGKCHAPSPRDSDFFMPVVARVYAFLHAGKVYTVSPAKFLCVCVPSAAPMAAPVPAKAACEPVALGHFLYKDR